MSATCGSCGEAIVWAITDSGRHMPLDAVPVDTGNVAVHRDKSGELRARVLKHGDTVADWETRGNSHYATCPHADQHRKPRRMKDGRRG